MSSLWAHGSLPALFFDDECVMCSRSAWFIDRRDRKRTLRFVALASDEGRAVVAAHPALAHVDSLIWLEADGMGAGTRAFAHSDAVFAVGSYLGGGWGVAVRAGKIVPRPVRDALYRLIARHRGTRPSPGRTAQGSSATTRSK